MEPVMDGDFRDAFIKAQSKGLTRSDIASITLILSGKTVQHIAAEFGITMGAVYKRFALLRQRLGATTNAQAIHLLYQAEILPAVELDDNELKTFFEEV